jgi:hypothetical protein
MIQVGWYWYWLNTSREYLKPFAQILVIVYHKCLDRGTTIFIRFCLVSIHICNCARREKTFLGLGTKIRNHFLVTTSTGRDSTNVSTNQNRKSWNCSLIGKKYWIKKISNYHIICDLHIWCGSRSQKIWLALITNTDMSAESERR